MAGGSAMDAKTLPIWKTVESPIVSLDESHVEMFSLLALFLFTLLALLIHKRRQALRHVVQGLSVLVFFYVVYSCLGVFGMIRNTIHGVTLLGTVFTESFFWMSLPVVVLAFTLTTGPYFCGWICPTGTFQEWTASLRRSLSRLIFRGKEPGQRVRARALGLLLIALFFVGFLATILWMGGTKRFYVEDSSLYWGASLILLTFLVLGSIVDDQAIRVFRALSFVIILISALMKSMIVSPVHFAFADVNDPASMLTTLVLVVASLFVSRAWCRYACPWGFLMASLHRISRLQIRKNASCTGCGKCNDECQVEAVARGEVRRAQCQFCLACVDRCPEKALEVVDDWHQRG